MITDKAVEASATALIREQSGGCYTYRPEGHPKRDDMDRYAEAHARAALEAAAPFIRAEALEDAANALHASSDDYTTQNYAQWLRARAAEMRQG